MNYYLFRNASTGEAESVYATWSVMLNVRVPGHGFDSDHTEEITQAEYETYKEFGIPSSVSPFDPNVDFEIRTR